MATQRTVRFTVALDLPRTGAQNRVFTEAAQEEFKALKESTFRGPFLSIGFCAWSDWARGNSDIPKYWRRMIRWLTHARIIAPSWDPWCSGARIIEATPDSPPRVEITLSEG